MEEKNVDFFSLKIKNRLKLFNYTEMSEKNTRNRQEIGCVSRRTVSEKLPVLGAPMKE